MPFSLNPNQPIKLRCIEKWFETEDCVSILLSAEGEQAFQFKPGQFVTLGVKIEEKTEYRAYSISSIAGEAFLQLTIKRVVDGKVSNYIVDNLSVGDDVECLAPTGEFNCIDHPPIEIEQQKKVLLISAGCGITPVYAMANAWLRESATVDIAFLHVAKSTQQTIYFDKLVALAKQHSQFNLKLLLKDAKSSGYPQGRLSAEWLETLVPDLKQRTVYLCGPSQFMLDTADYLKQLDFDMNQFYQESFTPAVEPEKVEQSDTEGESVSIEVPSFGKTLQANKGALLADALEQGGVPLIVACRSGICGSCKCKLTIGQVETSSSSPLTEEEIAQGYVLACSSTLTSDVSVEL